MSDSAPELILDHAEFLGALAGRRLVALRFYSATAGRVIEAICAPLDYGGTPGMPESPERYWLWDYGENTGANPVSVRSDQISALRVLREQFNPVWLGVADRAWSVPRNWHGLATRARGASAALSRDAGAKEAR